MRTVLSFLSWIRWMFFGFAFGAFLFLFCFVLWIPGIPGNFLTCPRFLWIRRWVNKVNHLLIIRSNMLMMIAADEMTILDLKKKFWIMNKIQNFHLTICSLFFEEALLVLNLRFTLRKLIILIKATTSYSLESSSPCVSVKLIITEVYLKYCWGPKPCW